MLDLFLFNLGLCVVVNWLLGIRQVLFPILYIFAFKHHTGTAGQDQFLLESNGKNHFALVLDFYERKKRDATHLRRLPHLHSSLQTRLNDCARALNVDPLKQHAVVAGWGR